MVDIGANIGFTSVYFARRFGARTVVAIEPDPDNAWLLRKNLASQNNIDAEALGAAAGEADGKASFARAGQSNLGRVVEGAGLK